MIDNPEQATRFLASINSVGQNKRVFVDLAQTQNLTSDALAVLAATIESDQCKARVFGNWPEAQAARQMVFDSGFYKRVKTSVPEPDAVHGKIVNRKVYLNRIDTEVATDLAKEIVDFACETLGRKEDKPSYGVLIDVMDNTFTHASTVMTGQVAWWATIYCDMNRQKACYCFADLGVGIFKSKSFEQRMHFLGHSIFRGQPERMRALLDRRIPSSTGVPYRGKGLPWIYESGTAGRIESLVIVANNVFSRPLRDEYRSLSPAFHGTFLYWET